MNFDLSLERILFLSPSFTFPDEVQDLFGPKLTTHLGFLPLHMYSLDQCTTAASQPLWVSAVFVVLEKESPFILLQAHFSSTCHFPTCSWDLIPAHLLKDLCPIHINFQSGTFNFFLSFLLPLCFPKSEGVKGIVLESDAQSLATCLLWGKFFYFSEPLFLSNRTYLAVFCEDQMR